MKSKISILLFLLFQFCFGQIEKRMPLHGQISNDSIPADNGMVYNLSAKTSTFINSEGFFDILAKSSDTLFLTGLAYKSRKIILQKENFNSSLLVIKMELNNHQLKEVVVAKKRNLSPIFGNTQKYVDKLYFDDAKSSPKNTTMPSYGIQYGVDFVKVIEMIANLFAKKKSNTLIEVPKYNFATDMSSRFKHTFFTNVLELEESEIALFLIFCQNDPISGRRFAREEEFQLTDFLITKSIEFKKNRIKN